MATVIVSLSGIRTENLDAAEAFAAELDQRGVPLSLLVAPRLKGGYRLTGGTEAQEWLRHRAFRGDAVVMHGYDQAAVKKRRAEFATLAEHEATLRLTAADRVLEAVGLRTTLFAPPRWLASPGALMALPRVGFTLCADRAAVRDLRTGTVQLARVLSAGGGRKAEPWWCRAVVLGAGRLARHGRMVRLSVDAKHLDRSGPHQAMLDVPRKHAA